MHNTDMVLGQRFHDRRHRALRLQPVSAVRRRNADAQAHNCVVAAVLGRIERQIKRADGKERVPIQRRAVRPVGLLRNRHVIRKRNLREPIGRLRSAAADDVVLRPVPLRVLQHDARLAQQL